jgi:hypothetical protein
LLAVGFLELVVSGGALHAQYDVVAPKRHPPRPVLEGEL